MLCLAMTWAQSRSKKRLNLLFKIDGTRGEMLRCEKVITLVGSVK